MCRLCVNRWPESQIHQEEARDPEILGKDHAQRDFFQKYSHQWKEYEPQC